MLVAAIFGALARRDSDVVEAYLQQIDAASSDTIMLVYGRSFAEICYWRRVTRRKPERIVRGRVRNARRHQGGSSCSYRPPYRSHTGCTQRRLRGGRVLSDELLRAARILGQPTGLAFANYARGLVLSFAGKDHDEAIAFTKASIELTRAGASDAVYAHALNIITREQLLAGLVIPAFDSLRQAIAYTYRVGDMEAGASVLGYLVWGLGQLKSTKRLPWWLERPFPVSFGLRFSTHRSR